MNKLHKVFELITEIYRSFQIMLSPTLIGGIIGTVVYHKYPSILGKIGGISIGIIGILNWNTFGQQKYSNSKKRTIWFLSRVMATLLLDEKKVRMNQEMEQLEKPLPPNSTYPKGGLSSS
jgi:hypothetical protein